MARHSGWEISNISLRIIFFHSIKVGGFMFELKFTEEQNMLRDMARDFTTNEIKPIAAKIDLEAKIPDDLIKKLDSQKQ